ncbi:MAG: thiol peroxidase [Candidatus Marinimicrobia bacterium]|nr:thiol peroxidase [Candidatus Neomarinimicrobiota bacterium]
MAKINLKGNPMETVGNLPDVGQKASDFKLVSTDLSEKSLKDYQGKNVVLNIFPSLDTEVCALSVAKFNNEVEKYSNAVVLCISADLPFAHKRFCSTNGYNNVINLSTFRNTDFGNEYGTTITTGPLTGLQSRAVVVIDKNGIVKYTEQVPEITHEPDYTTALNHL